MQLFNVEEVGENEKYNKNKREFDYNTVHRQLLFPLLDKKQIDPYKSKFIYSVLASTIRVIALSVIQ